MKFTQTFHYAITCVPFIALDLQLCGLHWTAIGLASTPIDMRKACNCSQVAAVTAINHICQR